VLNSERFCDQAPAQIWATLLDEGRYLASVSTMYRILRSQHQVRERRRQARHPAHLKPELVATGPNQVWSWDIERHEAFLNLAMVKGHRHASVAADVLKLRAA
jgi:putative transposase